ncbi:hypothetical protein [Helicobacter sp.]|uniref:hypothetical protein n=1 Tax=Helicobacter sp. TaxID=218 RepID=UPI00388CFF8A
MSIISKIFDICLFVPLQKRRATFNQALDSGEMSHEIPVSEAQDLLICGNGIFSYVSKRDLQALLQSQLSGGGGRTRTR